MVSTIATTTGEHAVSDASSGTAVAAQYVIRPAAATDLDWINTNDQGWRVHEHGGFGKSWALNGEVAGLL